MSAAKSALEKSVAEHRRMQSYHEGCASREMEQAARHKRQADLAEAGLRELSGEKIDGRDMHPEDFRRMRYMQAHYQ